MKRADLDSLTLKARALFEGLPDVTLRGDGEFVDVDGDIVTSEAMLRHLYTARQQARELHIRLAAAQASGPEGVMTAAPVPLLGGGFVWNCPLCDGQLVSAQHPEVGFDLQQLAELAGVEDPARTCFQCVFDAVRRAVDDDGDEG